MTTNLTYEFRGMLIDSWANNECFTIIAPSEIVDMLRGFAIHKGRDFDVLEEDLGIFAINFFYVNFYIVHFKQFDVFQVSSSARFFCKANITFQIEP